jgi:lipopolysaccharide export system protein LptC
MPLIKYNNPKKIKLFLLSVILITFGIIISIFVSHRRAYDKENYIVSDVQKKANISIGKVHQTATRDGFKEWNLDASSVEYIDKNSRAIFQDLSVTFYLKDKSKVYLTADQGILETDSNDIEVLGNVVVKNEYYSLKTENLHYKHNGRIIFSKVPVEIIGNSFDFIADSMSMNLITNKTLLQGRVKGTLNEKIML